jgi:hypothetical protein
MQLSVRREAQGQERDKRERRKIVHHYLITVFFNRRATPSVLSSLDAWTTQW